MVEAIDAGRSSAALRSLEPGERGWLQERITNRGNDRTIAFGFRAFADPFGIAHEAAPYLFALRKRFPGQEIDQLLVGFSDQDRPKCDRPNTVTFP